jgi:CHASE2 domain-containing sensor protein
LSSKYSKRVIILLTAFAGIALILFLEYLGIFEGINAYIYDMSFRIRGSRPPSDRIVIASIDEKSLAKYGRWPIRRIYYAELLDHLNQASVVGFDVIFSEKSQDDALFAEAIKRQGRVILPVYIDTELNNINPLSSFSPYRTGHIHVEEGIDNVVREVFHTLYHAGVRLPSLTSVMYETATGRTMNRMTGSAKSLHETNRRGIFQADPMKINYYGRPGTFRRVSISDVIDGKYAPDFFKDKMVLIGLTAPGIVDMVATPFSQERNLMSGVEVHANILNNLLDGNAIRDVSQRLRWFSAIVLSLFCFFLFMRFSERNAALLWLLSLIVVTSAVFYLFAAFNRWMSPALFYFSLSFTYMFTYILKLDEAARKLDTKYLSVARLLEGGVDTTPQIGFDSGLLGSLSPGGVNTKIQRLIRVEQQYEKRLEDTIQQKTQDLSQALSMLNSMSNEMIMRLTAAAESKDAHTGKHISRIGLYAGKIAEVLGMPFNFIEQITLASAMHDIGKIGIPNRILLKGGPLSSDEFEIIKTHTSIGAKILSGSGFPMIQMSATIAMFHHERWDGTGYPNGLQGDYIPVEARITMICDIYDALRSRRPYKDALDHERTVAIITEGDVKTMPRHFDPDVLNAFVRLSPIFEEIYGKYHD